jgi:two-component system cell cycle sensor histidine kinase/response regulator CckA
LDRIGMCKSQFKRAASFGVAAFLLCFAPYFCGAEESPYPLLTSLTEIRHLPQIEARKGYPVEFKATVLCFDAAYSGIYLGAGQEAIYARYPAGEAAMGPGDEVLVKGFTLGAEHNYIAASTVKIAAYHAALPPPIVLEGENLFDVDLDCKRVSASGTVERVKVDGSKWLFTVRQKGRQFQAQLVRPPRIALDPREWIGASVQFTGPGSIHGRSEPSLTRVVCPAISDVLVIESPRIRQPVKIADLAKWIDSDQWLVVSGNVTATAKATTAVKDDSGELAVNTLPFARRGDEVEVSGFAMKTNGILSLSAADAVIIERDSKGARRHLVTSIAQVRGLSHPEAEKRLPVRLRAVVTYCEPASRELFVHDGANGIFVWMKKADPALSPGTEVEVVGETGPGLFAPIIDSAQVTRGRHTDLPVAKPVTVNDMLSGREDAGLVEVAGVVHKVRPNESRTEMEIETPAGKVTARVACPPEAARPLEHATVRLSGVAGGLFNERGQIIAALIFVPDLDSVHVDEPAPADPFSVKRGRLHEVFRYRGGSDITRRVLVTGVVAWQAPKGGLYLVDGDESLFVEAPLLANAGIGSKVEAVGYPALGVRFAPILKDAVTRANGLTNAPAPRLADAAALRNGDLDACLVKVRARFIEGYDEAGVCRSTWKSEDGAGLFFNVILAGQHGIGLQRDTVADVTGLVRTLMNDERKAAGFELFLRSQADVAVISTPGWWTAARMWRIVFVLALVLTVSFAWVVILRRKVEQQTGLVKKQLAKEEELQRQYRSLFEQNPHPMWVFHPKTLRFLAVNETAVERYGYSHAEFLSMTCAEIGPQEERALFQDFINDNPELRKDAAIWNHIRKDGSRLFVEITARHITFANQSAILVLAHDVTERVRAENALRLSEAKFRRLVDSSLIGIVFFDGHGLITDANDCFLNMVGRPREEIRAGTLNAVDFAPPDRVERHQMAMQHLRTHGVAPGSRREFLRRDGSRAPAMVGAVAIDGTDGYVAFVLDLTKEATLEQQVTLAQKMEAVGLLAGGVAHDFNNLLQVIQGYTLLSLECLDENAKELRDNLDSVNGAAERAAELTRQLLVFSRQDNLKETEINVGDTLGETLKLMRRVIGEHIEVTFDAAPDLARIRADKGRIEQVLVNLCVNARDAMPKGGTLTIELSNVSLTEGEGAPVGQSGGPYVCLRVTDTGCGMDSATLARIYEPFFTTKSKEKGSGLGLSIVYGIVERHKGVIRVHSKVGAGTTFIVYFPAVFSMETKPASNKPEFADKGGMETILLVEDEPAVRTLAARVLKRAGYDVRLAADGVEACTLFKEHAPEIDLVLMDVIMPKMGGRDAYENIVKTRSDVPVIFCSGYSERELGAEFLESHGLDLLPKPYRPDELLTRIRSRLHPEDHS